MSKIWLLLLIASITTLLFTNPDAAISAMISGSKDAVKLAIDLAAVYALWLGLFAIIEKLGLSDKIAKLLRPLVRFLFKGAPQEAEKYITMNMSANLLGLGNASTPMGIKAMTILTKDKSYAPNAAIMLIVISATSLQLIPSTVIGMRASHGSPDPAGFLIPSIIATVLSTVVGIALVKLCGKLFPDEKAEKKALAAAGTQNVKKPFFGTLKERFYSGKKNAARKTPKKQRGRKGAVS